ncbi:MAG: YaiI/YqxD family protein [Legionellales bacterium]|nr:YaiI/YqxD family protein [Legionellales bacterium]
MHIWIDADACPKSIKEILFRAAKRTQINTTLVSNQWLSAPPSPYIHTLRVAGGFDVADNKIVELMQAGDIVITADIPLADAVVTKGGIALNPRGEIYHEDNIKLRLAVRNMSTELRDSGLISSSSPKLGTRELTAFANQLDRLLAKKGRG